MLIVLDCCQAGGANGRPDPHDLNFDAPRIQHAYVKHCLIASRWDRNTYGGLIYAICDTMSRWTKDMDPLDTDTLLTAVTWWFEERNS